MTTSPRTQAFARAIAALAPADGIHETALPGVQAIRTSQPAACVPVVYEPGLALIAQGRKRGLFGGRPFDYSSDTYLAMASPLPLEVAVVEATPETPLLCLFVAVDTALLGGIAAALDDARATPDPAPRVPPPSLFATPLDDRMLDAATRLVEALRDPVDARLLAAEFRREVVYRAMLGPQAGSLRALLGRDGAAARVARVLHHINAAPERHMAVSEMAEMAGMSVSAFHAAFKAVTSLPPLQYRKAMRLHRAQSLIAFEGRRVSDAAYAVGYASASQFSRDYRRLFGQPPSQGARDTAAVAEIISPVP